MWLIIRDLEGNIDAHWYKYGSQIKRETQRLYKKGYSFVGLVDAPAPRGTPPCRNGNYIVFFGTNEITDAKRFTYMSKAQTFAKKHNGIVQYVDRPIDQAIVKYDSGDKIHYWSGMTGYYYENKQD